MNESPIVEKRYEIVLLFDVIHGNPNGDPDAGNAPRVDPETGYGIVTDVCLKRKVRNFVAMTRQYQPPYDIFVKDRGILAHQQRRAYEAVGAQPDPGGRANEAARTWMCQTFFDVRTFGAVMTTGKTSDEETAEGAAKPKGARKSQKLWNCGQVRGPVQLGFSRSLAPVLSMEHTITRVALTNPGDTGRAAADGSEGEEKAGSGQMGRKHAIPYALYRAHGFISPFLAADTGFSQADLDVLLQSLEHLFDHDRSAARGEMEVRGLYVFEHESSLGNAPAHKLFDLVRIDGPATPRSFGDYHVTLPSEAELPQGVKLRRIV